MDSDRVYWVVKMCSLVFGNDAWRMMKMSLGLRTRCIFAGIPKSEIVHPIVAATHLLQSSVTHINTHQKVIFHAVTLGDIRSYIHLICLSRCADHESNLIMMISRKDYNWV